MVALRPTRLDMLDTHPQRKLIRLDNRVVRWGRNISINLKGEYGYSTGDRHSSMSRRTKGGLISNSRCGEIVEQDSNTTMGKQNKKTVAWAAIRYPEIHTH